jgi:hypothetical protein
LDRETRVAGLDIAKSIAVLIARSGINLHLNQSPVRPSEADIEMGNLAAAELPTYDP